MLSAWHRLPPARRQRGLSGANSGARGRLQSHSSQHTGGRAVPAGGCSQPSAKHPTTAKAALEPTRPERVSASCDPPPPAVTPPAPAAPCPRSSQFTVPPAHPEVVPEPRLPHAAASAAPAAAAAATELCSSQCRARCRLVPPRPAQPSQCHPAAQCPHPVSLFPASPENAGLHPAQAVLGCELLVPRGFGKRVVLLWRTPLPVAEG